MENVPEQTDVLDLFDIDFETKLKEEGGVFSRKIEPIQSARQVTTSEVIETHMPDGTLEDTAQAEFGDWVVTGPLGETFVVSDEKFNELYKVNLTGGFTPRQREILAIQNPTGKSIQVRKPWKKEGKPEYQTGGKDCFLVVSLDEKGEFTDDRYIIGDEEILMSNYTPK